MSDAVTREFLLAFWKIHILHHAEEQGVYGHWMLEELHRHGYRLSPGTLYPLLARMARHGWLRATEPKGPREARVYRITPEGSDVLKQLRASLGELQVEVARPEASRSRGASSRRGPQRTRARSSRVS
ncbi:MAG TPA: helix-turn-helix transcriptional regulator [Vicinamibacterales bacterium]